MNRLTAELREQTKQSAKFDTDRKSGADPEDADEYRAVNIFWVPKEARWSNLKANAKQPTIAKTVDDAMLAIERDNPSLKGVFTKDYAWVQHTHRPAWVSASTRWSIQRTGAQ